MCQLSQTHPEAHAHTPPYTGHHECILFFSSEPIKGTANDSKTKPSIVSAKCQLLNWYFADIVPVIKLVFWYKQCHHVHRCMHVCIHAYTHMTLPLPPGRNQKVYIHVSKGFYGQGVVIQMERAAQNFLWSCRFAHPWSPSNLSIILLLRFL